MEKIDYKKLHKQFYSARVDRPAVVDVPKMNYIMIDGKGDPNTSEEYTEAIQALYPLAYTIKFMSKLKHSLDFGVMPLEGLWWAEDMADFVVQDKSKWLWTAMIMQPEVVTDKMFREAVAQVQAKKAPAALNKIRFASYHEGRAAQVMYVGPYSGEGPTIQKLHEFIHEQGGVLSKTTKHHHEIYLGDPRRVDPSRLKTIVRQPF